MGPKKTDAVKLETGVSLENIIGPSEKRRKFGQVHDALRASSDARSSGINTRHAADIAIRNRRMRLKAQFDAHRGTSSHAAARRGEAKNIGIGNREMIMEPDLDAERRITINIRNLRAGVGSLRFEAPSVVTDTMKESDSMQKNVVTDKMKESECMQKYVEGDTKKSDQGVSTKARQRILASKLNDPTTQNGENVRLQIDVDAAQIAKQAGKAQRSVKLAKEEEESVLIDDESEVLMDPVAQEKIDLTVQRDDKLKFGMVLTTLERQKRKVEQDLIAMEKEAEDRRRLQQKELDQAQGGFERVRSMSLHDVIQAVKRNNGLENELVVMRQEKNRLKSSLETVLKNLEEEKEKRLCQICLESPKDTICFPCLHLNYCFLCLEKHRTQNNSCPSCRTAITGVLRCDLCI